MRRVFKQVCGLAVLLLIIGQLAGCARNDNVRLFGAVCVIYLNNLPQEFGLLPDGLRDSIVITVSFRNVSTDRTQ